MFGKIRQFNKNLSNSGQSLMEYILLLAIVTGFLVFAVKALNQKDLSGKFSSIISEKYKRTYQFGHPDVKDFGERDGPYYHARFSEGSQNFRIFINPKSKR